MISLFGDEFLDAAAEQGDSLAPTRKSPLLLQKGEGKETPPTLQLVVAPPVAHRAKCNHRLFVLHCVFCLFFGARYLACVPFHMLRSDVNCLYLQMLFGHDN